MALDECMNLGSGGAISNFVDVYQERGQSMCCWVGLQGEQQGCTEWL